MELTAALTDVVDVSDRAARELGRVRDRFAAGEVLADQAGAGAILTFTFSSAVELAWVRCDGGDARCDPFGGTPSASAGIVCEDGIPTPITMTVTTLEVYAPAASTVNVHGYRY